MSHFSISLTVWAKSRDGVHKPQFLKRKESRSGSNRGPSAYQPSALPLGHTGSYPVLSSRGIEIDSKACAVVILGLRSKIVDII